MSYETESVSLNIDKRRQETNLAIAVGNVSTFLSLSESCNDISEAAETAIDVLCLLQSLPSCLAVTEPFTAGQIH